MLAPAPCVHLFEGKTPVGSTTVTLFQYMTLQGTGLTWSEKDVLVNTASTGTTAPIFVASLSVSCGVTLSPCVANGDFHASPLKIGSSGSVAYGDNLGVGDVSEDISNTYTLDYEAPPYIPADEEGSPWSSPWLYRCDNGVAQARSGGCVVPAYTPTLNLSIKQAGASAALFNGPRPT